MVRFVLFETNINTPCNRWRVNRPWQFVRTQNKVTSCLQLNDREFCVAGQVSLPLWE